MRKIREVLRLYFAAALSIRAIARSLGTSPSTVGEYLRRAKVAGVSWPVPETIDDAGLERRLFPALPSSHTSRPLPDWSEVRRALRGKNVTLALLWQEYKAIHPEGLQYSRFCEQYREWAGKLDLVMRQEHRAGEKLFIDYAGQTVPVVDPETGEERQGRTCRSSWPCSAPRANLRRLAGWAAQARLHPGVPPDTPATPPTAVRSAAVGDSGRTCRNWWSNWQGLSNSRRQRCPIRGTTPLNEPSTSSARRTDPTQEVRQEGHPGNLPRGERVRTARRPANGCLTTERDDRLLGIQRPGSISASGSRPEPGCDRPAALGRGRLREQHFKEVDIRLSRLQNDAPLSDPYNRSRT